MTVATTPNVPVARVLVGAIGARSASIERGTGGRYPCTLSTETPVERGSARGSYMEVLSHAPGAVNLERAPLPLIEYHDTRSVNIGVLANLHLEGGKLRGDLVLGTSARALELAPDIESGIVTGLSVGYQINEAVESSDGHTLTVTRWTPHEGSLVACPADINAGIGRSLQVPPPTATSEVLPPVPAVPAVPTVEAVSTRGAEPHHVEGSKMTDEEIKAAQAKAVSEALASERARSSGIRSACEKLGQRDLADKMIADGTSLDAARALVIDAHAERTSKQVSGGPSGIEVGKEDSAKFADQVRGALLEKSGCMDLVLRARSIKGLSPVHAKLLADVSTDGGELRGERLLDIGARMLSRRGISTKGSSMELAKRTLTTQFGERAGYAPTSDFSVLYENVMYKVLLASYLTTETTWQRICKVDTVSSVSKPSNRFRVGSFGVMDASGENEEIKNKPIPDGLKFSITTGKYANIIGLSREAIIDDDMGANADVATRFGASYKLTLEKAFYDLLALNGGLGPTYNGNPFFHSANLNVGVAGALSIASIDADRLQMKRQKDISNNEYLNLSPAIILVPTELSTTAQMINSMSYDDTVSKFQKPNAVQNVFRDVVDSPRLSGTRRYTFADIASAPAFVMAFLEGQGQAPTLEMQEGWRTDGIEWRVKLFAKCQAFDPKGAMTNAGA
jgi:hypothetical protein